MPRAPRASFQLSQNLRDRNVLAVPPVSIGIGAATNHHRTRAAANRPRDRFGPPCCARPARRAKPARQESAMNAAAEALGQVKG